MKRAVQVALFIAVLTTVAFASPTLTFNSAGTTGTINYNPNYSLGPSNSTLTASGSGIDIDNLFAAGFPTNNGGPISCNSCTLSFTTGIVTSDVPGTNFWSFSSAGSTFTIFGTGIGSTTFSSTPIALLSGSFSTPITVSVPNSARPDTKFIASTITNTVYSGVTSYFGFPSGYPWTGDYSQSFVASRTRVNNSGNPCPGCSTATSHAAFNSTSLSTGVVHDTTTVPEPTSMILFSTVAGLIGFTTYRRRKQNG